MIRPIGLLAASVFGVIAIGVAAPAHAEPSVPFKNCTAAKAAGYCDITQDSPLYTPSQDRDSDGYACEC
ncbi:Excalibur domain protein [Mycolicibacterium rhodesiae JS60]|nr:Excalibur domain protein [Mycolicibacterium rhodesiae JS60]